MPAVCMSGFENVRRQAHDARQRKRILLSSVEKPYLVSNAVFFVAGSLSSERSPMRSTVRSTPAVWNARLSARVPFGSVSNERPEMHSTVLHQTGRVCPFVQRALPRAEPMSTNGMPRNHQSEMFMWPIDERYCLQCQAKRDPRGAG